MGRVLALRREQAKAGFDWDSSFHLPLRPSEIRSLDKALKVKASFMRKRQAEKSSRPVQLAACKPSVPTEQFAATPRKKAVRRGRLTAAMQPGVSGDVYVCAHGQCRFTKFDPLIVWGAPDSTRHVVE